MFDLKTLIDFIFHSLSLPSSNLSHQSKSFRFLWKKIIWNTYTLQVSVCLWFGFFSLCPHNQCNIQFNVEGFFYMFHFFSVGKECTNYSFTSLSQRSHHFFSISAQNTWILNKFHICFDYLFYFSTPSKQCDPIEVYLSIWYSFFVNFFFFLLDIFFLLFAIAYTVYMWYICMLTQFSLFLVRIDYWAFTLHVWMRKKFFFFASYIFFSFAYTFQSIVLFSQ